MKFDIVCKVLTPVRRRIIGEREIAYISKPLRAVIAVGGVWIFFYGTDFGVPEAVQYVANIFSVIGIAAVLYAVFSHKLSDISYFSKAIKKGCFPGGMTAGEGGVFVRRRETKETQEKSGVTSVNAEKFYAFAEIGKVSDFGDYFKVNLKRGDPEHIFLFKEDFGTGDPEVFKDFILSRRNLKN